MGGPKSNEYHKANDPTMVPDRCLHKPTGNFRTRQVADKGEEAGKCEEADRSSLA